MANPTTNYGWPMPTTTDLVTDLPADFAAFGQPVDTSLKALNPATTLGDLQYRSSTSNTNTRLGIGSTSQVLTVVSGVPAWATPAASSSGLIFITSASPSAASAVNINGCFTSTYQNYYVVFNLVGSATVNLAFRLRDAGVDRSGSSYKFYGSESNSTPSTTSWYGSSVSSIDFNDLSTGGCKGSFTVFNPKDTGITFLTAQTYKNATASRFVSLGGIFDSSVSSDGFSLIPASGTMTGTVRVYGIANS